MNHVVGPYKNICLYINKHLLFEYIVHCTLIVALKIFILTVLNLYIAYNNT